MIVHNSSNADLVENENLCVNALAQNCTPCVDYYSLLWRPSLVFWIQTHEEISIGYLSFCSTNDPGHYLPDSHSMLISVAASSTCVISI